MACELGPDPVHHIGSQLHELVADRSVHMQVDHAGDQHEAAQIDAGQGGISTAGRDDVAAHPVLDDDVTSLHDPTADDGRSGQDERVRERVGSIGHRLRLPRAGLVGVCSGGGCGGDGGGGGGIAEAQAIERRIPPRKFLQAEDVGDRDRPVFEL